MARMRTVGTLALLFALAAGLAYAMSQIRDLALDLSQLRSRMARESAPGPRVEPVAVVDLPTSPSDEVEDLAAQVARLQAELAALRAAIGQGGTTDPSDAAALAAVPGFVTDPKDGAATPGGSQGEAVLLSKMTPEQQEEFKRAVLKVVADQKRVEEQRQRAQLTSKVVADLAKALGLSGTQLDRAKQVLEDGAKRVGELRQQMTDQNAKQVKQEVQTVWKGMDQGVRTLLTAEQMVAYDAWRTTQIAKAYFGPPPQAQRPAPRPGKSNPGKRG